MNVQSFITKPLRQGYIYVRVSTQEQAENKTSLAQQERDGRQYCDQNGIAVAGVFVDEGKSGTDRSRPEFNRMFLLATGADHPVDVIVATDTSRIARDAAYQLIFEDALRSANVKLEFCYQRFDGSHEGKLMRFLNAWQDEGVIKKGAQNTRRGLRGTAEEGFWTGGIVPLGYESRTVEIRSKKEKKRLFIKEDEAKIVRLIFDLAEKGLDGTPMGGREIAKYLNSHGYTRRGKKFHNSSVADTLSRAHYLGSFVGNKYDYDGNLLPEEEWTWVACPQLVSREQFDRIAALRAVRSPRQTPPRVVSGPTLLVGLAKCGIPDCGSGMTIRTGKSGRYKYYACNARVNRGASSCTCPSVRAEKLDALVMDAVAEQIFSEDRLEQLLEKVLDTSDDARQRKQAELEQCEAKLEEARKRQSRLLDAIETGVISVRDDGVSARIKAVRTEIDDLNAAKRTLQQQLDRGPSRITPEAVRRFGEMVRDRLHNGDANARQNIARTFISQVRVGTDIKISGDLNALARATASVARSKGGVPSFDRKWCGWGDSNPHEQGSGDFKSPASTIPPHPRLIRPISR